MKLIFAIFLFASLAHAENLETKKLVSFEAFVQFSEGTVSLGSEREAVKYGTPIYEDSKIKLEKSATLKFVTKQNCVVVTYGEGDVAGPLAEKPWRITTRAARFLCPDKNEEKFVFHGIEITPEGETLFDVSGKIFVITGRARLTQTLASRHIYQYSKALITSEPNQQTPQAQYDFDNLYKIPREGEKLVKPKLVTPDNYRITFGPEFGPSILLHANGYLNHYDYSSSGPSLQFTFRNDQAGIILGLHYLETESQNQSGNYNNNNNGSNNSNSSDRLRNLGADVGYRFDFDRWWSPFARGGVTWEQNELYINSGSNCNNCSGYFSDQTFNYIGLSASIGIDALVRPSWLGGLGVFASTEIQLNQTVISTKQTVNNIQDNGSSPKEADNDKGFILDFNGIVHLGLLYQF